MKYLVSDFYSDYECIGGECPETCCGGWNIVIDDKSYEKYNDLQEPDRTWVLEKMEKTDGCYKMILDDNTGRCKFLNDEGWCLLYRNISPDMLCDTCKTFPRWAHIYYDLYVLTASIACPVVAKNIVNKKDPIQFRFMEDEEKINLSNPNWERYNEVINGFVNTVDILQDRRFTIGTRLYLALEVAREIQNCINSGNYSVLRTNIEPYCNYDNRLNIAKAFATRINHIPNIHDFLNHIFDIIHIGAKKILLLNRIYTPNIKSADEFYEIKEQFNMNGRNDIEFENIAVQLVFEKYMGVIEGSKIYDQFLKITIYVLILLTQEMYMYKSGELTEDNRVLLVSRLSRMMDHSDTFSIFRDDILSGNSEDRIYDLLRLID